MPLPPDALARFAAWPREERRLALRALGLLWLVRVGVSALPYAALERFLERLERPRAPRAVPVDAILRAVSRAALLVPGATCLVRALAGRTLLRRGGHAPALRIGVSRDADGALEAHAWLELDGAVVIGRVRELERFATLDLRGGDASPTNPPAGTATPPPHP